MSDLDTNLEKIRNEVRELSEKRKRVLELIERREEQLRKRGRTILSFNSDWVYRSLSAVLIETDTRAFNVLQYLMSQTETRNDYN